MKAANYFQALGVFCLAMWVLREVIIRKKGLGNRPLLSTFRRLAPLIHEIVGRGFVRLEPLIPDRIERAFIALDGSLQLFKRREFLLLRLG